MAQKTKSIQGTRDILPGDSHKWQYIEQIALKTAGTYGIREMRVPTMEKTELFVRSVGETTDVVQKEMYTFDKGKVSITLRPEGTAGIARAVLENSLLAGPLPVKVCYLVSCFRHEHTQAGRLREFHQFGVEYFGPVEPTADAEVIGVVDDLLRRLGIDDVSLELNSIGCPRCRPEYNKELVTYYRAHEKELCPTCLDRLERNPLRLLDCKEKACAALAKDAPVMLDSLCGQCADHFAGLKKRLEAVGIRYTVNPRIVRGLDYYTKTVFEFVTNTIGAQGTVCGGGRYDGLVEELGGPPTPGLGFAIGLERLLMVMEAVGCAFPPAPLFRIYIGSMGEEGNIKALELCAALRKQGIDAQCDTMGRSMNKQMKYADKLGAVYSCILGENEMKQGMVQLKHMESGESTAVNLSAEALGEFVAR